MNRPPTLALLGALLAVLLWLVGMSVDGLAQPLARPTLGVLSFTAGATAPEGLAEAVRLHAEAEALQLGAFQVLARQEADRLLAHQDASRPNLPIGTPGHPPTPPSQEDAPRQDLVLYGHVLGAPTLLRRNQRRAQLALTVQMKAVDLWTGEVRRVEALEATTWVDLPADMAPNHRHWAALLPKLAIRRFLLKAWPVAFPAMPVDLADANRTRVRRMALPAGHAWGLEPGGKLQIMAAPTARDSSLALAKPLGWATIKQVQGANAAEAKVRWGWGTRQRLGRAIDQGRAVWLQLAP